jgi:hypothetical protein
MAAVTEPTAPAHQPANRVVQCRLTDAQYEWLIETAAESGRSNSEVIRDTIEAVRTGEKPPPLTADDVL